MTSLNLSPFLYDDEIFDAIKEIETEGNTGKFSSLFQDFINNRVYLLNTCYTEQVIEEFHNRFNYNLKKGDSLYYPGRRIKYIFLEEIKNVYTCLISNKLFTSQDVADEYTSLGYIIRNDVTWLKVKTKKGEIHYFKKGELFIK
jgi:hypothetical protein